MQIIYANILAINSREQFALMRIHADANIIHWMDNVDDEKARILPGVPLRDDFCCKLSPCVRYVDTHDAVCHVMLLLNRNWQRRPAL